MRSILVPLILVISVISYKGLKADFGVKGDSVEYIIQAQSIVFDHAFSIDPVKRAEYWNETSPYDRKLGQVKAPFFLLDESNQSGGGFGSLYAGLDLAYNYVHSWMYPLFVAPLYLLLHMGGKLLGTSALEYQSFRIVNIIFLCLPFALASFLYRSPKSRVYFSLASALLLCSPVSGYVDWSHTEVFQFGLISSAFILTAYNKERFSGRYSGRAFRLAPVLLGISAGQNLPSLLFFVPLLLIDARENLFCSEKQARGSAKQYIKKLLIEKTPFYLAGLVIAALPHLYIYWTFGVMSVIEKIGFANLAYATLNRTAHFFLSPFQGAVWFNPALVILFLFAKRRWTEKALLLAAVFAVAYLTTSTSNLKSAQVGAIRYSVWVLAPLAGWVLANLSIHRWLLIAGSAITAFLFCTVTFVIHKPSYFETMKIPSFTKQIYRIVNYEEDPEIFAENISGRDLFIPAHFDSCYQYRFPGKGVLPAGNITLVSKRFFQNACRKKLLPGLADSAELCSYLNAAKLNWRRQPFLGSYAYAWTAPASPACSTNG